MLPLPTPAQFVSALPQLQHTDAEAHAYSLWGHQRIASTSSQQVGETHSGYTEESPKDFEVCRYIFRKYVVKMRIRSCP